MRVGCQESYRCPFAVDSAVSHVARELHIEPEEVRDALLWARYGDHVPKGGQAQVRVVRLEAVEEDGAA